MITSVIVAAAGVPVVVSLYRGWRSFWDRAVTAAGWRLGTWLALIAPWPLWVTVHELGHATAAKLSGVTEEGTPAAR